MAAHFTQANQEVHSYMLTDIPDSLKSNSNPQAIKSRNRIFQVSSTSQSQNSGGVLLFNIAPSNFSITKGSMALRARITFTGTGFDTATGTAAVGLDGPGPALATANIPALGNGYSVMQRMTLYGSNSSIIAQHNYLNDEMNLMLMHNSNSAYLPTDASLLLGIGSQPVYVSATSSYVDVVLPVPLSIFQSATQDFPAYLLSAPLTLQIDLASVARAVAVTGTNAVTCTEYSVSNTFLLFQAVELPSALIEAERMAVKSSPYVMTASSTLAVHGSGVSAQVYFDGNLINSNIVDNVANTFYMLKQFMHHNVQGNILQPSPIAQVISAVAAERGPGSNTYCRNYYSLGFDTTSFDEECTIFGGLPATNVNIQLAGYDVNPTFLVTVLIFFDVLVAFGSEGSMSVKR